jgi:hypothetical protein
MAKSFEIYRIEFYQSRIRLFETMLQNVEPKNEANLPTTRAEMQKIITEWNQEIKNLVEILSCKKKNPTEPLRQTFEQ